MRNVRSHWSYQYWLLNLLPVILDPRRPVPQP
jgi:hypothetical protein